MVLDVTDYKDNHPGGQFLLSYNIGRDISKFFYGGYQLENYTGRNTVQNHSGIARTIVNKLVVARLTR